MTTNGKYRAGVGMMLLNKKNQAFVGQRIKETTEAWQMPQGGIDEGEDTFKAALRELKEEIGTDNVELLAETKDWLYYDLPQEIASRLWNGNYIGQKQKWFLLRYLGKDEEINITTEIPEFSTWQWINVDILPSLIVPFKKELYEKVIAEFKPIIEKL
jgi:putative (di)nucleoside polyphosphate hydrolase